VKAERVAIIVHNNPDPDSMASAFGLSVLMKRKFKAEAKIFYGGIIGRAENRAMARELSIPMLSYDRLDLRVFRTIAMVDTQPSAGNNQLPPKIIPDIVIDHHLPVRKKTHKAAFKDVRDTTGATSTIILGYLRAADIRIDKNLATALFYGIKTDTYDLGRDFIKDDTEAYKFLLDKISRAKLGRIERPLHERAYFARLHEALENAVVADEVVTTVIRNLESPDIAAEVADWLYTLQPVEWAVALGAMRDRVHISIRTRDMKRNAAAVIRRVVGSRGVAGGHGQIAGGIVFPSKHDHDSIEIEISRTIDKIRAAIIKKESFATHPLIERRAQGKSGSSRGIEAAPEKKGDPT
jgi:nanoRNase/pAp phosphatase (c-di-AMP/oligoRNAs hydrolase)